MNKEKEKLKILIDELVSETLKEGAFTDPISDIFKTASYGVKKIGAVAGVNALKSLGLLWTAILPWVSYEESQKIEKRAADVKKQLISKLDSQYKDVLERNYGALLNSDLAAVAMLLNPGAYLSTKAGLTGTSAALSALSLILSPFPQVAQKVESVKNSVDKINTTSVGWQGKGSGGGGFSSGGGGYGGDWGGDMGGDYGMYESVVIKEDNNNINSLITNLLKDPEIINALKNTNIVKSLDRTFLTSVSERINGLNKLKNIDDFKKFIGDQEFNELSKKVIENLPKNQKNKNVDLNQMLPQIKELYKKSYIDILNKKIPNSSIPNEIKELINKLQ